ncbi:MAG: hypothetical protein J0L81_06475 [Caulobacterales bacterium]|jgi:hypothetical protein|nr:hypothetical protein [Caulobacterales bacterium]
MRAEWKYIVYRDAEGEEVIVTFNQSTIHADYADQHHIARAQIVSAGFVTSEKACFGASTSLHVSSRPARDTALLRGLAD